MIHFVMNYCEHIIGPLNGQRSIRIVKLMMCSLLMKMVSFLIHKFFPQELSAANFIKDLYLLQIEFLQTFLQETLSNMEGVSSKLAKSALAIGLNPSSLLIAFISRIVSLHFQKDGRDLVTTFLPIVSILDL